MGRPIKDMTGMRFGKLTVVGFSHVAENRAAWWDCVCDCGNQCKVEGRKLRSGHKQSCRCFLAESVAQRSATHGLSKTRLFIVWQHMKDRCYNQNHTHFKHYGGRGITVCEAWKDDFKAFYDWAMANGYRDGLTIDRIDVDGHYEPSNCQWITRSDNSRKAALDRRKKNDNKNNNKNA